MNKPQHTPGPWYVDEGANGDVLVVGEHPELSEDVCQVYGGNDGDKAQALADARAIAALPDLLAALEQVIDLFEWSESGGEHEAAYDSAREAIAKATSDNHIVDYSHLDPEGGAK